MERKTTRIDVAPAALVKIIAAVAVVWLWLRLWPLLMVLLVAVVIAIGLDPLVERLERRGVSRALGGAGIVVVLAALVIGFFWVTGASLATQARDLGGTLSKVRQQLTDATPEFMRAAMLRGRAPIGPDALAGYAVDAGRLAIDAVVIIAFILVLTSYVLIEGRQTYKWLVAYAPPRNRGRVHLTACEARSAIYGYVVGNVVTSLFAAAVVFVALSLLHVPAALLLALLAGVFDFVPVLGFICSAVPAVLLALSRSIGVAVAVAVVYIAYHAAENYYIGPRVYGERLRLSNLAVILVFAAGAAIGGIGGALLALPLGALYPVVERVWLKDYLNRDAVETHQRMQRGD